MKTLKEHFRPLVLVGSILLVPYAMSQNTAAQQTGPKEDRLTRMTLELGLSPEQVERIRAIHEDHAAKVEGLKDLEDKDQRDRAKKEARSAQREAINAVLTPEQQAKAEVLRAERKVAKSRKNQAGERTHDERADMQVRRMTQELGLSGGQSTKMKGILVQHMQRMEVAERLADEAQRKEAMEQVKRSKQNAVKAILTPEQRARMEALKAERKAKKEHRQGRQGPGDGKGKPDKGR